MFVFALSLMIAVEPVQAKQPKCQEVSGDQADILAALDGVDRWCSCGQGETAKKRKKKFLKCAKGEIRGRAKNTFLRKKCVKDTIKIVKEEACWLTAQPDLGLGGDGYVDPGQGPGTDPVYGNNNPGTVNYPEQQDYEKEIHDLINEYRKKNGLGPLKVCKSLTKAVRKHLSEVWNSHDGKHPYWTRAYHQGYAPGEEIEKPKHNYVGPKVAMAENLQYYSRPYGDESYPEAVVREWINSGPHEYNLLLEKNDPTLKTYGRTMKVLGVGFVYSHGKPVFGMLIAESDDPSCQW